jgi:hypothetical protein
VYPSTAIEAAVQAFCGLATIEVKSTPERHRIRFARVAAEAGSDLMDEFANYALMATVSGS